MLELLLETEMGIQLKHAVSVQPREQTYYWWHSPAAAIVTCGGLSHLFSCPCGCSAQRSPLPWPFLLFNVFVLKSQSMLLITMQMQSIYLIAQGYTTIFFTVCSVRLLSILLETYMNNKWEVFLKSFANFQLSNILILYTVNIVETKHESNICRLWQFILNISISVLLSLIFHSNCSYISEAIEVE